MSKGAVALHQVLVVLPDARKEQKKGKKDAQPAGVLLLCAHLREADAEQVG
jgi:hypothetical protein